MAFTASVSRPTEEGSSVSSQCTSTSNPFSAAKEVAKSREATAYS